MGIILTILLILITIFLCNISKWLSNNRICPGKHTDYQKATTDIIIKGKKHYYKNHLSGEYDIPDKNNNDR